MTSKTTGSDVESYTYDRKNRQIAYYDGDNYYSYNYRPDGLRSHKVDNILPYNIQYVWDGMNMVYEIKEENGVDYDESTYVYCIGLIKGTINENEYYCLVGNQTKEI